MPDRGLGSRRSADDSPGLAMWRATNRWQAVMRAALAPHGLTHVQYVLLASLVWLRSQQPERAITQAELAAAAALDAMMTSQVLRALEAKGLLERVPHPGDGRARSLLATPAGIAAARRATADVEDADDAFFAAIDRPDAFLADLARLTAPSAADRPARAAGSAADGAAGGDAGQRTM